jgi:hypothetical protein
MENYLNTLNKLQTCMKGYSKEDVLKMTPEQEKVLCLDEKHTLNLLIFSEEMNTRSLIKERLKIIADQKEERCAARRKLVEN